MPAGCARDHSMGIPCEVCNDGDHQVRYKDQVHTSNSSKTDDCGDITDTEVQDLLDPIQIHIRYPRSLDKSNKVATLSLFHYNDQDDEDGTKSEDIPLCNGIELRVGRGKPEKPGMIHVQLGDPCVSKNQFRIYMVMYEPDDTATYPQMFYIEDLRSCNGTLVNSVCIGSAKEPGVPFLLNHGDEIEVRPCWKFQFVQHVKVAKEVEFKRHQEGEIKFMELDFEVYDRCLGSGQFSKVYLACYAESRAQLAVKVVDLTPANLKMSAASKRSERDRLIQEIKILAMLNHPNIISFKKAFLSSQTLYIFEELAPGGDLMSFINSKGGSLSNVEALVVMRQVVLAVEYIHSKFIAHRDIKPENILVMHSEIGHRLVLADFGCAALVQPQARMMSRVGTEDYVAPEIHARSDSGISVPYTKAVDMWSVGVLALCLFVGESVKMELKTSPNQRDINSKLQSPFLNGSAKDFVMKCLILEPGYRLTAPQALAHKWFTKPAETAKELQELYKRATKTWEPRVLDENYIEIIPDEHNSRPKRVPDVNASIYFNLDKHLSPYTIRHKNEIDRQKQVIIDKLRHTGTTFYKAPHVSVYTPRKPGQTGILPRTPVKAVPLQHEREQLAKLTPTSPTKGSLAPGIKKVVAPDIFASLPHESQISTQSQPTYNKLADDTQLSMLLLDDELSSQESNTGEPSFMERPATHTGETPSETLPMRGRGGMGIFDVLESQFPEPTATAAKGKRKHVMEDSDDEDEEQQPAKKRNLQRYETLSQEEKDLRKDVLSTLPLMTTATAFAKHIKKKADGRKGNDAGGSK